MRSKKKHPEKQGHPGGKREATLMLPLNCMGMKGIVRKQLPPKGSHVTVVLGHLTEVECNLLPVLWKATSADRSCDWLSDQYLLFIASNCI